MNEVKIQIPDNCVLIKDGNTYIVKEKKQIPPKSWEEFCERYPKQEGEAYIGSASTIGIYSGPVQRDKKTDKNICVSEKEAKAFLALMQLRQLRKAWVGAWDYNTSAQEHVPTIMYSKDEGIAIRNSVYSHALSFPTEEMAKDFLNCFKDLCETAKILL